MPIINIVQVILSVLLMISILLQQKGDGLGSAFGGGGGGGQVQFTKRGAEKFLFISTIILAVLFLITAIARIII